jgi:hypothetical protein
MEKTSILKIILKNIQNTYYKNYVDNDQKSFW